MARFEVWHGQHCFVLAVPVLCDSDGSLYAGHTTMGEMKSQCIRYHHPVSPSFCQPKYI